jgi:uncharacterized membrane protein
MQTVYPLITSLVALLFAVLVLRQYLQRRGSHQLIWAIALFIFSFAAFCEFFSEVWGWPVLLYKVYYVAAATLVAYLGLGTIYLIWKRRVGNVCLVIFLVLTAAMLVVTLTASVDTVALQERGVTVAGKAMPRTVRLFSPLHTIPGTLALVGGAIYSVYLFWRRRQRLAYRISANIFIAAGAMVIAAAGGMARSGQTAWLYPAEMVGTVLMFVGFLQAGTLRNQPRSPGTAERAREP